MPRFHFVALSDPVAGREDEFDRWYSGQHIPDILDVPGFLTARRFWAVDSGNGQPKRRRHMVIYELESDDPATAMAELHARRGTERLRTSDSIDLSSVFAQLYEQAGQDIRPGHPREVPRTCIDGRQ